MNDWMNKHITRWQGLAFLALMAIAVWVYTSFAVRREVVIEIGNQVDELQASVAEFKVLVDKLEGLSLTQNNNQQINVGPNEAELRDRRIRDIMARKQGDE